MLKSVLTAALLSSVLASSVAFSHEDEVVGIQLPIVVEVAAALEAVETVEAPATIIIDAGQLTAEELVAEAPAEEVVVAEAAVERPTNDEVVTVETSLWEDTTAKWEEFVAAVNAAFAADEAAEAADEEAQAVETDS